MNHKSLFLILAVICTWVLTGQSQYQIRTVAFYNVENLFDTLNDTLTYDDDRTAEGKDRWTPERYELKLKHIVKVLSDIGADLVGTSPDIIGLCEVENRSVIEDLVQLLSLEQKDYGIVHFDSPDERGIDVALLYKKAAFFPTSFASHRLVLHDDNTYRDYTRDQLVVGGMLDDEQFYFTVNHWPSRSGGEARSKPNRLAAARLNKQIIDSILEIDFSAKIISMGDLNDDPLDDSLKKILKTEGEREKIRDGSLFNPMEKIYKKGIGSLAYRDKWNLFDQFVLTPKLLHAPKDQYRFWKAGVFNPSYLVSKKGRYKGYPFRTYAGGNYAGGYSDHFPVFLYLIRPLTRFEGEKEKE